MWSRWDSFGHKATDQETAVREVLNALEMPDRIRTELLAIILQEFARIRKMEAENDAEPSSAEGNETNEAEIA